MNQFILKSYRMGTIRPNTDTLRFVSETRYAVTSCGAWVRLDAKKSKKRRRF